MAIKKLIAAERATGRSSMVYEILGTFGDRISTDVQKELRFIAENEMRESEKFKVQAKKKIS